jgi:hypothetical protein
MDKLSKLVDFVYVIKPAQPHMILADINFCPALISPAASGVVIKVSRNFLQYAQDNANKEPLITLLVPSIQLFQTRYT